MAEIGVGTRTRKCVTYITLSAYKQIEAAHATAPPRGTYSNTFCLNGEKEPLESDAIHDSNKVRHPAHGDEQ